MGDAVGAAPTTPPPDYPTTPPPDYQAPAPDTSGLTLGKVGQIVGEEAAATPGRVMEGVKSGASSLWETLKNPTMGTVLPLSLAGPAAPAVKGAAAAAPGIMGRFAQGAARAGATGLGTASDTPGTLAEKAMAGAAAAGTAALWEAAFGLGQKLGSSKAGLPSLNTMRGRTDAYQWATEAPMQAYEAIKGRVPPGKFMFVPTIDPKQAISAKEAAQKLSKMHGLDYEAARKEIKAELDRLDIWRAGLPSMPGKGPRPYAGSAFETRTSPYHVEPSAASRAGSNVAAGVRSPLARTAADIVAAQPNEEAGMPQGAIPPLMLGEPLMNMARRWLPAGMGGGYGGTQ